MSKRRIAWCAIALVALASLLIGVFGLSGVKTVRLSAADLQARIDKELPREYKGVTLTRASLSITEKDVHIALELEGRTLGQHFSLEATGVGVPRYDRRDAAFYFAPSKLAVEKLVLSGESATERAGKFVDRYVTDQKLKERIAASIPGVERWVKDNLESHALAIFAQIPLYKAKNDLKGIVIKATLSDVAVHDGALVLSFSLLQLTITVLLACVTLLASVGFAFALFQHPNWGAPALLVGSLPLE